MRSTIFGRVRSRVEPACPSSLPPLTALDLCIAELRNIVYYNSSAAVRQWGSGRRCNQHTETSEEVVDAMGTQIPMLYSAQLCYSTIRAYELSRGEDPTA